jgi:hypothetical protein
VFIIQYQAPGSCPICGHELTISRLTCSHCPTKFEGEFTTCKFCRLPGEQRQFIEVFIKCRGNIKDVEKELGISYPTVRNRLDGVIEALGYRVEKEDPDYETEKQQRQEILEALERGEITPPEAAKQIKHIGK